MKRQERVFTLVTVILLYAFMQVNLIQAGILRPSAFVQMFEQIGQAAQVNYREAPTDIADVSRAGAKDLYLISPD